MNILREYTVPDGYDVEIQLDSGQRRVVHFVTPPADTLAAVTAVIDSWNEAAEASITVIAEDGTYV